MTTPDAALLWAREQAADDEWPQYAELIRSGKLDDIGEVSDRAEAHRAGQSANAERVAALTAKCEGQDRMLMVAGEALTAMQAERDAALVKLRLEIADHLNTQEERDAAVAEVAQMRRALQPFARAGTLFTGEPGMLDYDQCIYRPAAGDLYALSGDDLRRARIAYAAGAHKETTDGR
jgi:hypothetical protein